ncbi:ABC-type amino acid transport/signal transduction system, periplasmic component/domain protein [Streptococcus mitis 13/39]|uniref:ABC-type amino acid transport/signal transduction system, periplasmic component/domain protein n=1 Tax=Streptococcus mitis 13/39 TaxID=1239793 RepID=R0MCB5_STRMT|nr:ABC-type amino acid transport/signal transduction system, periplasmic component/domain protein [Streptococcus mitis 13/39]
MKLFKPLLTVLALAFALIFVTACSSGGNAGSSSGKTTAKLAQSMKSKKAANCESPYLEIRNLLVTLTMTVLTKVTISNLGTNWHKTLG